MKGLSARGIIPACAVAGALAAAAVIPNVASAAEQCSGANVRGKGSSAQKLIQHNIWNKQFNTSANALACSGAQGDLASPKVTYESTGSGEGLESWGIEKSVRKELWFGPGNAFIGSEIAPNAGQEKELLTHTGNAEAKVLTIPVAQMAIAVIMHLPKGCTAVTGGPATAAGTIALKAKTVEEIFEGKVTEWKKILNKAKFVGAPIAPKEGETAKEIKAREKAEKAEAKACGSAKITRVVREDGSGTTDQFKKFLNILSKNKPVIGSETWSQNGEKALNTTWPNEGTDPVARGKGGGALVSKVVSTESSIGYANVADARANAAFDPSSEGGTGGPGTATFWAEVENGKGTYANPATNGEKKTLGNSNCNETAYSNFENAKPFPPPTTEELWNGVAAALTQKHYSICALTYTISLTHYKGLGEVGGTLEAKEGTEAGNGWVEGEGGETGFATEAEANAVHDYVKYELSTGAGGAQEAAEGQDYLGDPTNAEPKLNVHKLAEEGAALIGW
jgi:ABC-type phosphate transport system substrate-binding protein